MTHQRVVLQVGQLAHRFPRSFRYALKCRYCGGGAAAEVFVDSGRGWTSLKNGAHT